MEQVNFEESKSIKRKTLNDFVKLSDEKIV